MTPQAGTRLYAVRSWIAASLTELTEFDGVLVTPTWKTGVKKAERIYSRQGRFTHTPANLRAGNLHRDEDGTFELVVYVEGVGKSLDDTCQRAVALGAVFEDWLANHRSPGADLPGVMWVQADGPGGLDDRFNDIGSLALLSYTIRFRARLQGD